MVAIKPFRLRSDRYLDYIRQQSCLVCGAQAEAHHVQFAQPRAMGRRSGDQWAVPLCHAHHMQMHESPMPERTWWALHGINPVVWARNSFFKWSKTHGAEHPDFPKYASGGSDEQSERSPEPEG